MNRGVQFLIGLSMVLVVTTFMCVSLTSAIGEEGASLTTVLLCLVMPIVILVVILLFFGTMISNILRGGFGGFWDAFDRDDRRRGRGRGRNSDRDRDREWGGELGDWVERLLGRR